jgi:hypothetical protein
MAIGLAFSQRKFIKVDPRDMGFAQYRIEAHGSGGGHGLSGSPVEGERHES